MIVIADTSPIRYLVLLGLADLLPKLYGQVIVPEAVLSELCSIGSPKAVREFCESEPDWLEIRTLSTPVSNELLEILDLGESEAIQLATEIGIAGAGAREFLFFGGASEANSWRS